MSDDISEAAEPPVVHSPPRERCVSEDWQLMYERTLEQLEIRNAALRRIVAFGGTHWPGAVDIAQAGLAGTDYRASPNPSPTTTRDSDV